MRFNTNRGATDSSPRHEQERERRRDLSNLIDRLGELAADIPDPELREQINRWLVVATNLPSNDREFVDNRLEELNSEYPMYRERGKTNDECFPTSCLDRCDHAQQQACPMLTSYDVIRRRRRIQVRASSTAEYRDEMKSLAADVGCHVVSEAVRVAEETHHPVIRFGQLLLAQAQQEIVHADPSDALAQELASMDLDELAEEADIGLPEPEHIESEVVDADGGDQSDPDDGGDQPARDAGVSPA